MTFSARISRCPIPYEPDRAAEAVARFSAMPAELRELIRGAAGCSPYLAGLMGKEADWLEEALAGDPAEALGQTLAGLAGHASDQLPRLLRQAKARVALLAGLADLGGVWTLEEVTAALTGLADQAVHQGLCALAADEIRRGRLPGKDAESAADAAGIVALAMGKMGAAELNYSSDIDLICLFDDSQYAAEDVAEARASCIKIVRRLTALLSDLTADGYVFRTDLRLRPDAAVTPVCISVSAAESYYEAEGRTWERAAFIKARGAAGDRAAGARFIEALTPFVWRRHLDFVAIQDAHDMRLRIRDHKKLHGPLQLAGHNLKLGQGGIREIEFFTQTRQLIAGGRDPDLRHRGTVPALAALADKGWVTPEVAAELTGHYRALRELEHRVQMIADAQTHDLPASDEGFQRLAAMMGTTDSADFRQAIEDRLHHVAELTEAFFAPSASAAAAAPVSTLAPEERAVVDRWRSYPALRSERAARIFKRVQPQLLSKLMDSDNPSEALLQFDGFIKGLPAGVQLFSLFEANPALIELIVDICGTAPGLASYLSRNAGVLDAVLGGSFFSVWPGCEGLTRLLSDDLARGQDYEALLGAVRRWTKEWHFRIGVHHLRGLIDAAEVGRQYADLAGAVLAALWPHCVAEFARKHGAPPGRGGIVLGMGSLGAERLNAASDLDLIVIYDAAGVEMSDGRRPLATRAYYARLTQAFVTALSAPMAEGRLYEVDMRLRPSGRQGPVAVSLQSFQSYQMSEAWTWEHLALTRARVVAGGQGAAGPGLAAAVEAVRQEVLAAKSTGAAINADTADMRERLFAAKPGDNPWDPKSGPGRLQDIELFAQSLALRCGTPARRVEAQLRAGQRAGLIAAPEAEQLQSTYRLL
ncbi:MAG: bifunctional [glutamate--ammonia ligase]-adenylyl-L-tyrosine phosphorylase/[glutamate--ammonia-ligase] adenylyltransferase, partial [Paracoccaceae bacterium]